MRADIIRGLKKAAPIAVGYVPIAFTISAVSLRCGISPLNTVLMFVLVDAGSSQMAAAHLMANHASMASVIITTFIINLRHLLMSSALGPYLRDYSSAQLAWFGFQLTDEAFALHSSDFINEKPSKTEVFTINMALHGTWMLGGCLGLVVGSVGDMLDRLGLDFAPAAMFVALLAMLIKSSLQMVVAVFAGILTVYLTLQGFGAWSVITSTLLCASLMAWFEGTTEKSKFADTHSATASSR